MRRARDNCSDKPSIPQQDYSRKAYGTETTPDYLPRVTIKMKQLTAKQCGLIFDLCLAIQVNVKTNIHPLSVLRRVSSTSLPEGKLCYRDARPH